MWIVAVAWVYAIGLVALSETSFVAGIMTFLGYCVLPLSILFYLTGGKARRARRARAEADSSADAGTDHSSHQRDRNDHDTTGSSDSDSAGSSDGGSSD